MGPTVHRFRSALATLFLTGALISCIATPEQELYQSLPSDPGGLSVLPTETIVVFLSTEAVPVEQATALRTAVAGIKDSKAVAEAFAAGFEAARGRAGSAPGTARIHVADAEITAACVVGRREPEAQTGIVHAVVDVTRPACTVLQQERRVRYFGLIGGAQIKSTEDESGADMSGIAFGWETSHTFWIGTHVVDAKTGATVCSRSQHVDASTSGSVGIILFIPMVLHWGIDAAEYWRAAAWRTGFDAGGCFLPREPSSAGGKLPYCDYWAGRSDAWRGAVNLTSSFTVQAELPDWGLEFNVDQLWAKRRGCQGTGLVADPSRQTEELAPCAD